jgi:hypothetical protein
MESPNEQQQSAAQQAAGQNGGATDAQAQLALYQAQQLQLLQQMVRRLRAGRRRF